MPSHGMQGQRVGRLYIRSTGLRPHPVPLVTTSPLLLTVLVVPAHRPAQTTFTMLAPQTMASAMTAATAAHRHTPALRSWFARSA